MMTESVLSCVTGELTGSVVAGLNSQEESHAPVSLTLSSATVSDLATIIEAVTLGETSEDEGISPQLAAVTQEQKPLTSLGKSAPVPVPISKPVSTAVHLIIFHLEYFIFVIH